MDMTLYTLAGQMLAEAQTAPTVNVKALGLGCFIGGAGVGWIAGQWSKASKQVKTIIIVAAIAVLGLLLALSASR